MPPVMRPNLPPVVLALPASLTQHNANAVLAQLGSALAAGAPQADLWVDGAALTRFDSVALAVLLQAQRLAQAQARRLQLTHLPAHLRELAGVYGLLPLFADKLA